MSSRQRTPSSNARAVAVFDFDQRLTAKHSLRPFIRYVVGTRRWLTGIMRCAPWLVASGPHVVGSCCSAATLWADGDVSLADEQIDVRVVSAPKEFTPASVRTPIEVRGPLTKPAISVKPTFIVARAAAAVLLGLLNPLAAVVPFFDPGAPKAAHEEDAQCSAVAHRAAGRLGEVAGARSSAARSGG